MQPGTMPPIARDLPSNTPSKGVTPRMRTFLAIVAIVIVLFPIADLLQAAAKPNFNGYGAIDFDLYLNATRRWLAGGGFFEPYQLAGPVPHPDGRRALPAQRPAPPGPVHGPAGHPLVGDPARSDRVGDLAAPASAGVLAIPRLLPVLATVRRPHGRG